MIQTLITITRTRKLRAPRPMPELTEQEARSWFSGWWHGLSIGVMCGIAVGVLLGGAFQ